MLLFVSVFIARGLRLTNNRNVWWNSIWTLGFVLFVGHVVAAYHFEHHWSHQAAVIDTAKQTRELIGVEFGGGVYFNYLFLVLWGVDVVVSWFEPNLSYLRALRVLWISYLLFIAFNGVVVFKSGWLRALGLVATAGLVAVYWVYLKRSQDKPLSEVSDG